MANIWGIPHNRRAIKKRGLIRVQRNKGGGLTAASWPKGGQYDKSPAGYQRSKTFGEVQHWSTRPLAIEQIDAMKDSEATMFYPRDILVKMAYGKLVELKYKDGRRKWPLKIMSQEAQAFLNTITTEPGSLLLRTASEWVGLPPGPPDTVLTASGPGELPKWKPPVGGAGGAFWITPTLGGVSDATGAGFFGARLRVFTPLTVGSIAIWSRVAGITEWLVTLAEMTAGNITAIPHQETVTTAASPSNNVIELPLSSMWPVEVGKDYAFGVNAISAGAAINWGIKISTSYAPGYPTIPNPARCRFTGLPSIGKAVTIEGDVPYWAATKFGAS